MSKIRYKQLPYQKLKLTNNFIRPVNKFAHGNKFSTRSQYPGYCTGRFLLEKTSSRPIKESLAIKVTLYLMSKIRYKQLPYQKLKLTNNFSRPVNKITHGNNFSTRSQYPGYCKGRLFLGKTTSRPIKESLAIKVTLYLMSKIRYKWIS